MRLLLRSSQTPPFLAQRPAVEGLMLSEVHLLQRRHHGEHLNERGRAGQDHELPMIP